MLQAKTVADLLTATRLLLAFVILLLGPLGGQEALGLVMMVQILAWSTDVLDGNFARRDRSGRSSWWDDKDFPVDLILVLSLFLYLTISHFILPWFALLYLALAILLISRFRSQEVAMSFMAPVLALALYLSLREAPFWGYVTILWCLVTLVTGWPRFLYVVQTFIQGMRDLQTGSKEDKTLN